MRSIARRRAVTESQAPGLSGTPSRGQVATAAANASWTASSASWKSPTCRISVASTAARSSRNARSMSADGSSGPVRPRSPIGPTSAPDRPDLDRAIGGAGDLLRPLERAVEIGRLDHEVAREQLLRLGERPVGDLRLAVAHPDGRRRVGPLEAVVRDEGAGRVEVLRELRPLRTLGLELLGRGD